MKKSLFYTLLLYTAASVALCGCTLASPSPKEEPIQVLTIGTADIGGTMYPVGKALAHHRKFKRLQRLFSQCTGPGKRGN